MKPPRIPLGWVMIFVGLVAVDLGVVREIHLRPSWMLSLRVQGTLLVANALAVGFVLSRERPGLRPFFQGFAVVGGIAAGSFLLATFTASGYAWADWSAELAIREAAKVVPRDQTTEYLALSYLAVMSLLGAPQLLLALLGGGGWAGWARRRAVAAGNVG